MTCAAVAQPVHTQRAPKQLLSNTPQAAQLGSHSTHSTRKKLPVEEKRPFGAGQVCFRQRNVALQLQLQFRRLFGLAE